MALQEQPLSKLLRGLARADASIFLHLRHLDRRLARLIYSAIPNKAVTIRTLYTQESPSTKAAPDELEAIHLLTSNSNLYSKASFELRMSADRLGEYAIVDCSRLISCLDSFSDISRIDQVGLISVSTDLNQISRLTELFNSSWLIAEEVTEKTLVALYNEVKPTQEESDDLSARSSRSAMMPAIEKLLLTTNQEYFPIDTIVQGSHGISATLLPAPLTALVRKSLEDRYKAALETHVAALARATMSSERIKEKTRVFSEFAESFLRRLSNVLAIKSVPAELAIAIRHPSVRRGSSRCPRVVNM